MQYSYYSNNLLLRSERRKEKGNFGKRLDFLYQALLVTRTNAEVGKKIRAGLDEREKRRIIRLVDKFNFIKHSLNRVFSSYFTRKYQLYTFYRLIKHESHVLLNSES